MRSSGASPTAPVIRVLIIDDNRNGLLVRRAILEQDGYATLIAQCPVEGLRAFELGGFDLVITDYRMPIMNGAEVIQRLRQIRPETPVILISSVAEVLGLDERSTGADAVISKTANEAQQMLRTVARLLRTRAVRKNVGRSRKAPLAAAVKLG
jgi:CheY-like chemotaxis protein